MIEKTVTVKLKSGMESRPVAMFVQTANQFKSSIHIQSHQAKINAKSIMGMMSLGVLEGEEIKLSADGPDEEEAISALIDFLNQSE